MLVGALLQHISTARYRRDDVVVRASALQSVDLGFIPQVESYQKTFKQMIFTVSLLGAQHRDSVKNKPASLLVVPLGKAGGGAKQPTHRGGPV